MILFLTAALLLQLPPAAAQDTADTLHAPAADSSSADKRERPPRRIAMTPELARSAFDDAPARALLQRARAARLDQDTSLIAYDAAAYQRISVGLGVRRIGRERLLFRRESAARVRWQRGVGAHVDVLGARQVVPMTDARRSRHGRVDVDVDVNYAGFDAPIPYFPGQETLWIGSELAKAEVNDREVVHPIADGAEAYYKYQSGDSVLFRLPGGRTIRLQELRVRPREPRWNLAVGSLWFDASTAQLVRAVYRLAVPMDIWQVAREDDPESMDDVPAWVKPMISPMRGTLNAMTVEYGLYEGRFWLPRLHAFEAVGDIGFMRAPVSLERSFRYSRVNGLEGTDSLPEMPDVAAIQDSIQEWRDSVADLPREQRDSARAERRAARRAACETGEERIMTRQEFDGQLAILVRVPCDTAALARAPELPPSIYDEGEDLFGADEREALISEALSLGAQPDWSPQSPVVSWGLGDGLLRYNRVEGLSPALRVQQELGRGYTAQAMARIGSADLRPRGELALTRSDGRRTVGGALYSRLGVANDWGDPLGFGASAVALLIGRDEGFYYRSWGAELRAGSEGNTRLDGRLFVERQSAAPVETQFSLNSLLTDHEFLPNIAAERGTVYGAGARATRSWGDDPAGVRVLGTLRGEGGGGDFTYARGLADVTLSRALSRRLDGALTLGAGSSAGTVPAQRLFYIGGPHTVRGQDAGTGRGEAFWMARGELGSSFAAARPVLFYDIGWAGARGEWSKPGRPLSGAGAGISFMDGLMRVDLARGISPEQQWRLDFYLEARF